MPVKLEPGGNGAVVLLDDVDSTAEGPTLPLTVISIVLVPLRAT